MNLQEAIEVLKDAMYIGSDEYASDYDRRMKEAIDTVITELEKPTTPKEIEDARKFIRECHADIGFMGSSEYYEKRKMLEEWDKKGGIKMTEFKKHTDKIAISVLRGEYADYDKNWWHYDREYNMLLKAQTEAFKLANEASEQQDKEAIDTVISEGEKPTYMEEDMEEFSFWYHRKVSVIGESELHLFGVRPFGDIIDFWKKERGEK